MPAVPAPKITTRWLRNGVPQTRTAEIAAAPSDDVAWTKLDHAIAASIRLASVALRQGDRVGLMSFGTELGVFVRPDRGRAQIGRLLDAMHDLEPDNADAKGIAEQAK